MQGNTEDPHHRSRKNNCVSNLQVHVAKNTLVQERPCKPEFGPGTSAPRSLRVRVGYIASFNRVASEQVLRMTRADSPWAGLPS